MSSIKKEPSLNATEIKNRGWTAAMIRDLLDPPDYTAPNNSYGKNAPRIKRYLTDRVEKAESAETFKERIQKADVRREARKKSAEDRKASRTLRSFPTGSDAYAPQPKSSQMEWDKFQLDAMASIDAGRSVLVCAPTGAGKTAIAEHAIAKSMSDNRKAIYTTPIKALSNQKYRDLSHSLGTHDVGLMTGDVTINPDAPVVVMTTEVLRNMNDLLKRGLRKTSKCGMGHTG